MNFVNLSPILVPCIFPWREWTSPVASSFPRRSTSRKSAWTQIAEHQNLATKSVLFVWLLSSFFRFGWTKYHCNPKVESAKWQYLEDEVTVGLVLILELPGRLVSHGGCWLMLSERSRLVKTLQRMLDANQGTRNFCLTLTWWENWAYICMWNWRE